MLNIFNIWEKNNKEVPFAAKRTHWTNKNIYVIIEKVEPDGKGYGKAYGFPVENGKINSYFEYNKKWRENRLIPNSGVYGWEYVEDVPLDIVFNNFEKEGDNDKNKNSKSEKNINDRMGFGKYSRFSVEEVIEEDINYIDWAIKNISWFKLSSEAEAYYNYQKFEQKK